MQLIEQEIPDGRKNLQENFVNLEKVAQYCQENYVKASDKKKALEETKNFTTHSLASVAYQINNLATNFLKLLDLQQSQLAEMESNVNHLAQTVNIHKEKVARREIGVLTTNRTTTRPLGVKNGIIFPEHSEKPTKYQRKNIDYSQLDDIGHGVKTHQTSQSQNQVPSRSSSISTGSSGPSQAPSQHPPTPPSTGSIGRAAGQNPIYQRTQPPTVAPPTVPSDYASQRELHRGSNASQYLPMPATQPVMGVPRMPPGMMGMGMPGQMLPPMGVARPMSQNMPPPPPPPGMMMQGERMSHLKRDNSIEDLPPPPMNSEDLPPPPDEGQRVSIDEGAPPPPPPPQFEDDQAYEDDPYATTGPQIFGSSYIPEHYLEKVIAIYDYQADKDDELTFTENSVIYVLKKNDDGWYEGVLNGQTGLFPGNYVEPCI